MSDDPVIEFLRERGRIDLPGGFVGSVMAAVEAAPPPKSWFASFAPLMGALAAVVALIAVVYAFGPGRPVGPAASPSVSATPVAATIEQLEAELDEALDVLREAPGVQGTQSASLGDVLGSATWFEWSPNGDQVVIQRWDLDVTQTGWWLDPDGAPPAIGERVPTSIYAFIGDQYLFGGGNEWASAPREDGPPIVSIGTGLLDGVIDPTVMLGGIAIGPPDVASGELDRRVDADGGVTWTAVTPWRGGTATQTWRIGPDGALESWSWTLVDVPPNPEEDFFGNATAATLEYEMLDDVDRIPLPDLSAAPDPAFFGLPEDFPMTPASPEPAGAIQVAECADPTETYRVTLPDGWWTNTTVAHPVFGELPACRFFAPEPFDLAGWTEDDSFPRGVAFTIQYIPSGCIGSFLPLISSREATVDGRVAGVAEYARTENDGDPPGRYEYVVDLAPDVECEAGGRFILAATDYQMAGDYEANKLLLDEVMASMRITVDVPPSGTP